MLNAAQAQRPGEQVALTALFLAFLKVSLCGFGGGLMWARRVVVEQRRWLDDREFAEILTLCQLMPGPNIVGITTCVGAKLRGAAGAIAAVTGFILLPWVVGLCLGSYILQHAQVVVLQNVLRGLSAAGAGLLIGTGLRLLTPYRNRRSALLVAALAFAGMALSRLPLPIVLLGLAPLSMMITKLERAKERR